MPEPAIHTHKWRLSHHLDLCHASATLYVCDSCGMSASMTYDRDLQEDPYGAEWLHEKGCEQCDHIRAGGSKHAHLTVIRDSVVIYREHLVEDQGTDFGPFAWNPSEFAG